MELDTGASVTVVSEKTWHELFPNRPVNQSQVRLKTYTGEPLAILGQGEVEVAYGEQVCRLPLVVVGGCGPSLFGLNWLRQITLDWGSIKAVRTELDQLLQNHEVVFRKELGTLAEGNRSTPGGGCTSCSHVFQAEIGAVCNQGSH